MSNDIMNNGIIYFSVERIFEYSKIETEPGSKMAKGNTHALTKNE